MCESGLRDKHGGPGDFAKSIEPSDVEALMGLAHDHALIAARQSAAVMGRLTWETLEAFLGNCRCVRYPTTIRYDSQLLEPHQFADVEWVGEDGERRCVLHIHPRYEGDSEALPLLVAYWVPVINYGTLSSSELCEEYGAALTELTREEYYARICALADRLTEVETTSQ